jgi:hypothetical protein
VLCVWLPYHARRRFELDSLGTLATGLFLGTLPCTALWATGGLATMPTALLLFGVYERLLGDPERPRGVQAGVFAAASGLIRADGALWVLLVLGAGALVWLLEGRSARLRRALAVTAAWLVVCVGLHVAWRLSYYGDWLPNTARVKAGLSRFRLARGADYVATFFLCLPSLLLVSAGTFWRWPPRVRAPLLSAAVVILGGLAYALFIGGDFMPFGRFLFSAVPFFALLFAGLWRGLGARPFLACGFAIVCVSLNVLACFDLNAVPESLRARFHFRLNGPWKSELAMRSAMVEHTREWSELGRALALVTQPGESMPLRGIGAIGYYSHLEIFDCYGLVSPEILQHSEPRAQASPGHDVEVPSTFFYPRKPTLGGAFLSRTDAPASDRMPPDWEQHPASKLMRLERHPLPAERGFAPGAELRLMRFVRWP